MPAHPDRPPSQRPTAKELLQHRFVKYARKTAALAELVTRHAEWKTRRPPKSPKEADNAGDVSANSSGVFGTVMSAWAFDSVRDDGEADEGGDTIGAARGARLGSVSTAVDRWQGPAMLTNDSTVAHSPGRTMLSLRRCRTRQRWEWAGQAELGLGLSRRWRLCSHRELAQLRSTSTQHQGQ